MRGLRASRARRGFSVSPQVGDGACGRRAARRGFSVSPQVGDKSCCSPSSSATLSSSGSGSSEDKRFGSGDLADPELLGLAYAKGASTDSGIDTAPCLAPAHLLGGRALVHSRAEPWADAGDLAGPDDDEQAKLYAVHGYAPALAASGASGSLGDLSEVSSHSRWVPGRPAPVGGGGPGGAGAGAARTADRSSLAPSAAWPKARRGTCTCGSLCFVFLSLKI